MPNGSKRYIVYTGPSMNPTLKTGDILEIIPNSGRSVQSGDVIVFHSPVGRHIVAHRVISIDSKGIKTRGDHNKKVDSWTLKNDDILGRVVSRQRKGRFKRVIGGPLGLLITGPLRYFRVVDNIVSNLLRPPYYWLAKKGWFTHWILPKVKMRVIAFKRHAGTELQLLLGPWVIGRWPPDGNCWHIQRPFKLFVDEANLPANISQPEGI